MKIDEVSHNRMVNIISTKNPSFARFSNELKNQLYFRRCMFRIMFASIEPECKYNNVNCSTRNISPKHAEHFPKNRDGEENRSNSIPSDRATFGRATYLSVAGP